MKSNINRRKEIFEGVLPPKGTPEYFNTIEDLKRTFPNDKRHREFHKKCWEKATKSFNAQYLSHCDLVTETSLRHFLKEFNFRTWEHGLRSMPVMFNIMEAFFNYRKPEIYFELIEEENYLISFFDFIDYITSQDFEVNKNLIEENITPDIIYNFNVGKDLEEITLKNDDGEEFIIAGISIIRRESEITVMMVTGKKKTDNISFDKKSFKFNTDISNKVNLLEQFQETLKNTDLEYEYIDKEKNYIKVIVACRIDIETMTIDARYIAEETNLMFHIVTDEIPGFLNEKGEFVSNEDKETYDNCVEKIGKFSSIFEAIQMSLYLPYFFNSKEDFIIEEMQETHFKKEYYSPINKRMYSNVYGYKCSLKTLYSLDTKNILSPDKIKIRDDLFKVQTDGYWKKIGIDEIGLDKKGKSIHGRTWVNQTLSWFEAKEQDLIIEKASESYSGENSGFIYILRNPTMEKNIFKIGFTKNEVDHRANQLSKTSVPDKFYKSQEWNVKDCIRAEKEIHNKLNDYRVDPRREFFKVNYDIAIQAIKEVIEAINAE
jgi:hypothetical protein